MDIESFHKYCMAKKGVEETFPFNETTLVFKVMGKMFALTGLDSEEFKVNLKCAPEWSQELRDTYEEVQPGWHMNKLLWNTVNFEGELGEDLLRQLIDHSYDLVVASLPKKVRAQWEEME